MTAPSLVDAIRECVRYSSLDVVTARTFTEAGLPSKHAGLVITLLDGTEFNVTVVPTAPRYVFIPDRSADGTYQVRRNGSALGTIVCGPGGWTVQGGPTFESCHQACQWLDRDQFEGRIG